MRTFGQNHKQSQKPVSVSPARSDTTAQRLRQPADIILHLQRTIGNQAVQRILQNDAAGLKAGLVATSSSCVGRDLSPTPLHTAIQTKLSINKPGDEFEQEADRVSEEVMRMSGTQVQRACACGAECPKCQNQPERLQAKSIESGDVGEATAPPVVDEVLRSSGQPLDATTRMFMEPRFRRDFSQVRVHTDARAAESATAIGARAYTNGYHVAFGAGQFQPETEQGRRLLAHELTHVVQQTQAPGFSEVSRSQQPPAIQRDDPEEEVEEQPSAQEEADDLKRRCERLDSREVLGYSLESRES